MSCIPLTDPQRRLLAALTDGPRRVDDLDVGHHVLDELRTWGWVFGNDWIELTGAGHYHAGTAVGGLASGVVAPTGPLAAPLDSGTAGGRGLTQRHIWEVIHWGLSDVFLPAASGPLTDPQVGATVLIRAPGDSGDISAVPVVPEWQMMKEEPWP